MATAVSLDTIKKSITSILQASQTAYGSGTTGNAPDGSNRQYSSATEFTDRILEVDLEVCTRIALSMQSPYQTTFIQTSSAIPGPSGNLPARNGTIIRVTAQNGIATQTFLNTEVMVLANYVSLGNHGLVTGQKVQLTNPGTPPTGLAVATDYWIVRASANTFQFATSAFNALNGTVITMSGQGTGTNTITTQYTEATEADTKDSVVEAFNLPSLFASSAGGAAGFWKIEGDTIYTSSPNCKVVYTDVIKTSAPQAPEPYEFAVTAGTVAKILKDGGDDQLASYYLNQYQNYLAEITAGATVLPAISLYKN